MKVRRARAERFGAIVATEGPPALLSVSRPLARRLGVDGGPLWAAQSPGLALPVLSAPTEVHMAVTERCPAGCPACYADAQATGHVPRFEDLCDRLRAVAKGGAFQVAFGGGEPALRPDVARLGAVARDLGLEPTLTTGGLGITAARARQFRVFAQVNVSLDGVAEQYEAVRGYPATTAERAIGHLVAAGVPVGVNAVLTRPTFEHLPKLARHAEALGAVEIQLLRFKPAGRGAGEAARLSLSGDQVGRFPAMLADLSRQRALAVRIDCALVPFLTGHATPGDLLRFGVMGCEAGRSLMALDAHGRARPCSFFGTNAAPVELSGPAEGDPWATNGAILGVRRFAAALPAPCRDCDVRTACRGGCRVVAAAHGGPAGPDPDCPRVQSGDAG